MVDVQRSLIGVVNTTFNILSDPKHTKWVAPALLAVDGILCALIIRTVAYTEIDWNTYMQQVALVAKGQRDYLLISGDTGPLVYPAVHVWLYWGLYVLTDGGKNIVIAQVIFTALYVLTLGLVMACYRMAKAPPYLFPMLILSKRLHSIFILRLFNDCFTTAFLFLAIYLLQKKKWTMACIVFSIGLGVKMSMLLVAPALAVILYQALGGSDTFRQGVTILNIQAVIAMPFLRANWKGYISRAFEFTRQFLYKWTVNWKFVEEETFLSRPFAIALLVVHVSLLLIFIYTRWLRPLLTATGKKFWPDVLDAPQEARDSVIQVLTPQYILTTMLTANVIGMLCARSLHFQFFAWLGWATPFLLWRAKLNPVLQYFLWFGQELAWNMYPSNPLSSKIVVGVLALTVLEVWLGTDEDKTDQVPKPPVLREGVSKTIRQTDEDKLYRALAEED